MPELPEVETVRRGLAPYIEGARIERVTLHRPDLRFPFPQGFATALEGRTIAHLGRRAKYLVATLSDGATWLSHLGMTGAFLVGDRPVDEPSRIGAADASGKHIHFEALLTHPARGPVSLSYSDPRRFGFMDLFAPGAPNPFTDPLGPEPLGNGLDALYLGARLEGKKGPIKTVLLDQRVIAGLGNIYVCEALHASRIDPRRAAGTLGEAEIERLVAAIRQVLEAAIAAGGSTLRDFARADGQPGYFQHSFAVYGHEGDPCPRPGCGGEIERIVQAGRSTFFCPVCQD
ncbi:bifunctional DNA-formamidopyrimidine glycosylase/DNA-(apurinic or apyrimidinic site) lyase [Pelagibacterium sp. 26DY04]|uniref:bifunctional DNA-formamidopyrimidine glycosylase/DNA-(apurinic or apyrimidinic site) lyase n=1 Tax=Pelagibacterium sp. 26DY04 TaxID=2967130 RepID=UPI002814CF42|nr:bifunctional DNA-formamidopyrimidine glycosylase/DNA-(apurinic or apyrimidinic site) lyase [Pelagibacterium sp. 26DY04]WMT87095.1 bifunctional DNA-formamidopyrimidine glycosylase/DNA-(apurinic or apyrimidinic site) lyase [Pelagibacterium sp. 26DY04]